MSIKKQKNSLNVIQKATVYAIVTDQFKAEIKEAQKEMLLAGKKELDSLTADYKAESDVNKKETIKKKIKELKAELEEEKAELKKTDELENEKYVEYAEVEVMNQITEGVAIEDFLEGPDIIIRDGIVEEIVHPE